MLKKIDTVEKEFWSFTQKHSLLVTKQQGQLSLQKTKSSDKCCERQEKTATKADNFLRLQEQMRSAACVGSYHHSNQYSDMGSTFQDAFVTQPPPPQYNNMMTNLMGQQYFKSLPTNNAHRQLIEMSLRTTRKTLRWQDIVSSPESDDCSNNEVIVTRKRLLRQKRMKKSNKTSKNEIGSGPKNIWVL